MVTKLWIMKFYFRLPFHKLAFGVHFEPMNKNALSFEANSCPSKFLRRTAQLKRVPANYPHLACASVRSCTGAFLQFTTNPFCTPCPRAHTRLRSGITGPCSCTFCHSTLSGPFCTAFLSLPADRENRKIKLADHLTSI